MLEEQMHHTNAGFQGKPLKIYHRNWYCPVSGSNVLTILPQITSPSCISAKSKTLIHNIFSTDSLRDPISRNIITSISDHLAQSLLYIAKKENQGQ